MRYAFGTFDDLTPWFILGFAISATIVVAVPDGFFEGTLFTGWTAMLVMLVAGVPLYVCATASTPIAAAMAVKGLEPGAALVFLLAGPATNVATILVVRDLLGMRASCPTSGASSSSRCCWAPRCRVSGPGSTHGTWTSRRAPWSTALCPPCPVSSRPSSCAPRSRPAYRPGSGPGSARGPAHRPRPHLHAGAHRARDRSGGVDPVLAHLRLARRRSSSSGLAG